ncbi:MAG: amidohydrolase family protein [Planctomycetota bacterium]
MKIINAHVHMLELRPGDAMPAEVAVLKGLAKTLPLLKTEELLRQMDVAGIEKSVLYAVAAPIVYASNEHVARLCREHPDRFIGFASSDVHGAGAVTELRRAVEVDGLRGFKFHPPLQGFSPDDPKMDPIYELAVSLNVPIVFHTGTTPFGKFARLKYANPILLDEVACRWPRLRILITHLGTLWHNEAMMVVEKNPGVFLDTSDYPPWIRKLVTPDNVQRVGEGKYIFGTDYPMPYRGEAHDLGMYVKCIKGLPLPEPIIRGIFWDNFWTFLNGRENLDRVVTGADLATLNTGNP